MPTLREALAKLEAEKDLRVVLDPIYPSHVRYQLCSTCPVARYLSSAIGEPVRVSLNYAYPEAASMDLSQEVELPERVREYVLGLPLRHAELMPEGYPSV